MTERDDLVWRALADPVRREILDRLRDGPQTTGALCAPFAQTRFGVMKHLDALEAAGLIAIERRGRERWNYLNGAALQAALTRWLTPFQRQWADRLGALRRHMEGDMKPFVEIRQSVSLPAPPARVFSALTREIGDWWAFRQTAGGRLSLQPEIGAPLIETGADGHAAIWARIEEIQPPGKLYFSGRFAMVGAVAGRVHFDLVSEGDGCRLTVAHQAVGAIAEDTEASFGAGWRELIERALPAHLARV